MIALVILIIVIVIITLGIFNSPNTNVSDNNQTNPNTDYTLNSTNKYSQAGKAYLKENNYKEALTQFINATAQEPSDTDAWYNLGFTYAKLGRYEDAVKAYDKVITLDQKNAVVWFNRGRNLAQLNRTADALTSYDKAIALDPEYAFPWYNKGIIQEVAGNYSACSQLVLPVLWSWTTHSPLPGEQKETCSRNLGELLNQSRHMILQKNWKARPEPTTWNR